MAKYSGSVGYAEQVETSPGVWENIVTPKKMRGDVIGPSSKTYQQSDKVNDDFTIASRISVVADPYAYQNFERIKCIEYMGNYWKVSNIEIQRPRLIFTLGGLWNGKVGTSEASLKSDGDLS